jgi:hypothetical protein
MNALILYLLFAIILLSTAGTVESNAFRDEYVRPMGMGWSFTSVKSLFGIVSKQDFSMGKLKQGGTIFFRDWIVHTNK